MSHCSRGTSRVFLEPRVGQKRTAGLWGGHQAPRGEQDSASALEGSPGKTTPLFTYTFTAPFNKGLSLLTLFGPQPHAGCGVEQT